ncbi:hypothetical protein [Mycolicibacterium sediminis]|uniref:Uncharacterized protein n=1 Tax=Mycolicibacterium sediminis TaxID=1286180 RepID=A0A7I7QNX4_9MYCO|nr:hypothetical protein [Mycolicibacterium sediminis]BBY28088.1 hypothetical protein MSEDJ_21840 [Mycolicibacterium sediminis]
MAMTESALLEVAGEVVQYGAIVADWLRRTERTPSQIATADVLADLDHGRGEWPNARR